MTIYRTDRANRRGGGTAIILRSNITHKKEDLPQLQSLEATAITIETTIGKVTLIAAYITPGRNLDEDDLINVFDRFDKVLLGGDLNAKHIAWNSRRGNDRGNLLYNLEPRLQAITIAPEDPTYIPPFPNQIPDVLDVAVVKNITPDLHLKTINDLTSHHLPVLGKLTKAIVPPLPYSKTTVDWNQFKTWLNNNVNPTVDVSTTEAIDHEIAVLSSKIRRAAKQATTSMVYMNPYYEAFPPLLQDLKYLRNRARKQWQRTRNPQYRRELRRLSRELTRRAKEWRAELWEDRMATIQLASRDEWQLIRNVKQPKPPKTALIHDGRTIFEPLQRAELFASTYEEQNTLNFNDYPNNEEEDNRTRTSATRFRQTPSRDRPLLTTPDEIRKIIRNLKSNSAPGPDKINNDQIKNLPRKPLVLLTRIYNSCMLKEYFPIHWKTAKVVPIPKRDKDLHDAKNHRPISLLSTLSKILERLLLARIRPILIDNNVIREEQFAFQQKLSAEIQLLRITEYLACNMNISNYTAAIFLDIEKAYDKVWRDKLITKILDTTDIPECYVKILDNFLQDRRFYIQIDGQRSEMKIQNEGIPQGSVLSPALFTIYVNDLPKLQHILLAQFADDTALLTTGCRLDFIINRLQRQIDILELWAIDNKIKINAQKTQAIMFTRRRPILDRRLTLQNQEVPWATCTKYLGVELDHQLRFTQHVMTKKEKITKAIHGLYPFLSSTDMTLRTKLRLYQSTILPMMLYGCSSWGTTCETNIKTLQILQNRCLRIILHAPRWTRIQQLHVEAGIPTVAEFIKLKTRSLLDKIESLRPNTRQLENVGVVIPAPWHKIKVPRAILQ